ncbi:MAG: porin [Pseudomonadota bacterium]
MKNLFRIFLFFIFISNIANASELDELRESLQMMQNQMLQLQEKIDSLEKDKAQRAKELTHIHKHKKPDHDSKKHDASDVVIKLAPAPKIYTKDGNFSAKFIGFMQADATFFNDDDVDQPDSTTIKRARLGLKGKYLKDWGYKFLYDFGNDSEALQDAYIDYNGLDNFTFTLGQFKEPSGFARQNVAKYFTFVEIPLTHSLTAGRSTGFNTKFLNDNLQINLGVFGDNVNNKSNDDEGTAISGQLIYYPIAQKDKHLHLGINTSYRNPDAADDSVSYAGKISTSSNVTNSLSTGSINNVDNVMVSGVELLAIRDSLSLQAEYVMADIMRGDGNSDERFESYYVFASWMLTGETKKIKRKYNAYKRVKPLNPFNIKKSGGIGAFELASRYEHLDLTDDAIQAGEMDRYTVGLNWFPNQYTKFLLNYAFVDTDELANIADDNSNVITMRAQIEF